ncbi:MAG: hypothetical protein LVQ95_00150 [Candidatus Micrarchaeales archaeon]|nr:hypothetical protein [Candidatus Micrarchaeales archaeon]
MDWIDEFLASWEAVEKTTDWRTAQPFSCDALDAYFYDIVIDNFLAAIGRVKPDSDLQRIFPGPGNVRNQLVILLAYSKLYHIRKEERMKILKFMHMVLRTYSPRDPFAYKHTAFMLKKSEIFAIVNKIEWQEADPDISREVGKLSISLASLAYALYTDATPSLGSDFHGPYDVSSKFGRGCVILARDYYNLKPTELWPDSEKYKYKSIVIYAVYKDVKVNCDFYGNFIADKNLIQNLTYFGIIANGKQVKGIKRIKALREYIGKLVVERSRINSRMSFEQVKRKFMETEVLPYKNLFAFSKIDWKPTPEMIRRIKGKKLLKNFGIWGQNRVLTAKDLQHFRKIMDPRTEVYFKRPRELD